MNRRLIALTVVASGVVAFGFGKEMVAPAEAAPNQVVVPAGAQRIPADQTRAVQSVLSSYGYTIAVDGQYGPQTTKVVMSWQRSNGLLEDGIAGPITQASLGITAERGTQIQVSEPDPPSIPHYDAWVALAQCESGGNWSINTGNGYYGGIQFLDSTWDANGGEQFASRADLASAAEQMVVAENLWQKSGFHPWPQCARKLGLV